MRIIKGCMSIIMRWALWMMRMGVFRRLLTMMGGIMGVGVGMEMGMGLCGLFIYGPSMLRLEMINSSSTWYFSYLRCLGDISKPATKIPRRF
jgi:hypothetical protein